MRRSGASQAWLLAFWVSLISVVLAPAVIAEAASAASPSPSSAAKEVQAFVAQARSVEVSGTVAQVVAKYRIDLTLFANGDSAGTIAFKDHPAQIEIVGKTFFIKGSAGFWETAFGQNATNAKRLALDWLAVPRSSLTGLGANISFVHLEQSFQTLKKSKLTKIGLSQISGDAAVGIQIAGEGTLWLDLDNLHEPLAFSGKNNGNTLNVHFSNWGRGSAPRVPSGYTVNESLPNPQ
jgi:hypothetical protein